MLSWTHGNWVVPHPAGRVNGQESPPKAGNITTNNELSAVYIKYHFRLRVMAALQ
jgi:hypothetical protein